MSRAMPEHWLLLRGLAREQGHWGDFPDRLRAAFEAQGRPVVLHLLDLPGNGALCKQRSPVRVQAMVEACRAQLAGRTGGAPCRVLALSLAGMVCTAWADRYPQELVGMVLVNTSMRPFSRIDQRLRPAQYGRLLRLPWMSLAERERAVLAMTTRLQASPARLLRDWEQLATRHPVSAVNVLRQLLAAARFRAPGSRPPVPVLLLASGQDDMVDVRCSRALAKAWQVPILEHPEAGHDLPLDDPQWLIRQLLDWRAMG